MKRSVLLLAFACGPKSAAKPPPVDNAGGKVAPAPVYAGLFVEGARWTFDVETLDDNLSDTDPSGFETTEDAFQATCGVETFATFADITIVEVTCDDRWPTTNPLVGVWAMDPRGLWTLDEFPDAEPPYLDGKPVIANPPAAWQEEEHDDTGELVTVTEVVEEQGAWCWKAGNVQGDSSWDTICFDGGPRRGNHGWSGAEEHSFTFERAD